MALRICYSRNPPEDHAINRAIYLDQAFYEMIFRYCRKSEAGFAILGAIASLGYKSPTFVVQPDSLVQLSSELERLAEEGHSHPQLNGFCEVVNSARTQHCSLTVSGDMYRELQDITDNV